MITLADITAKRKRAWEARRDINYDNALVRASVREILSSAELKAAVREKPYLLIEIAFTIVDKNRQTVPFFLNDVQIDFIHQIETCGTVKPFFVLKGRQQGFTTVITAMQLAYAIVMRNFAGFTIADSADNTIAIFNDKARMVYERLPEELKPTERYNSRNELFFDKLNSSWRISTASEQVGRSRTLNFVHFSEVAFYEIPLSSLQKGIGEALVKNALVVYETTANGYNEAKDLWDSGACVNLFYEWWRSPEYRIDDLSVLDNLTDEWISERVALLRSKDLDEQQIAWYVNKYNSYLDKNTIKQEYPISAQEAFVSSGQCAFDKDKVVAQIERVKDRKPSRVGYFKYDKRAVDVNEYEISGIEWVDDSAGYITIHEEPFVEYDTTYPDVVTRIMPYAIGGDTAGTGEDYFTAKVIDNISGRTVATLHKQHIDEDVYADQLYCLGMMYHEAIIGVEVNYSTAPTRELEKLGYPNLYKREIFDTSLGKTVTTHKAGFETTSKTRPVIIAELVQAFRENPNIECDIATLDEFLTFCKNKNGRYEAIAGKHDDLVMAKAIANFIGKQGTQTWIVPEEEDDGFFDNWNIKESDEVNLWD